MTEPGMPLVAPSGRWALARPWARRAIKVMASLFILGAIAVSVLWQRCGLKGCPDVSRLHGYMPDEASVILDREGAEVGKLFLTRRVLVALESLPKHVPDAFVAMEDQRFWKHHGVDWRRVLGAAWKNVKALGIQEGSSTITMQLARNVFREALPANEKTIWRKIGEARVARDMEKKFSKNEILQLYLNQIYFGNGAYGIEAAAREYFGKPAAELTLPEAALLAALPRAPTRLNPRNNPDQALAGRRVVLDRMRRQDLISREQAQEATGTKLRLKHGRLRTNERAPYFVEAARRQLEEQLGDAIYSEGYIIHTTLDQRAQEIVETELRGQMLAIESGSYGRYPHTTYAVARRDTLTDQESTLYLQAAVVLLDPRTGDVRALIGGRDYEDSQFNRATQAARQPGSAFKPFVYAAAVSAGYPPTYRLMDRPIRLVLDRQRIWEPKNYDGSYAGALTMRDALTYSKNAATVRLAMDVGIDRVVSMAHQIGLEGRLPHVPAVVLGAAEVTPLNLTAAYATFASMGQHPRPRLITKVVDRNGNVVWSQEPMIRTALDPAVAYLVTSMMKDVIDRGTGTAVRAVGFQGAAAGKTGTTNDAADVWFVGFTPDLVGTVWMGFDKRKTVLRGATGGELAAPLWGRIVTRLGEPSGDWTVPPGVDVRQVDNYGNVIGEYCSVPSGSRAEYFLTGTAPVASCYADPGYAYTDTSAFRQDSLSTYDDGWWRRLRRRLFETDTLSTEMLSDTSADPAQRDTTRPRLLGRPVTDPTRRPLPDTLLRN